ncbi:MAG TPA: GspH/FimT family pseudopilin [Vicinamibacterales bacterium]
MRPQTGSTGLTLVELVFVLATVSTLSGIAVPPILRAVDDYRATSAARHLAARLQRIRMEAVLRSASVALKFSGPPYAFSTYVDGNGDGVLAHDIDRGVDWLLTGPERLSDSVSGVEFGTEPGLPAVDPGSSPPGTDPIHLGASNCASFSPNGTSSSGSVYLRSRTRQLVIRIYGETGKTRVLWFDPGNRRWRAL